MTTPINQTPPTTSGKSAFSVEQAREYLEKQCREPDKGTPSLVQAGPTPTRTTDKKPGDHGYSKTLAAKYGIPAALALKYLAHIISASKQVDKEGRQFVVRSIQQIAEQYPYLSKSVIHAGLRRVIQSAH